MSVRVVAHQIQMGKPNRVAHKHTSPEYILKKYNFKTCAPARKDTTVSGEVAEAMDDALPFRHCLNSVLSES